MAIVHLLNTTNNSRSLWNGAGQFGLILRCSEFKLRASSLNCHKVNSQETVWSSFIENLNCSHLLAVLLHWLATMTQVLRNYKILILETIHTCSLHASVYIHFCENIYILQIPWCVIVYIWMQSPVWYLNTWTALFYTFIGTRLIRVVYGGQEVQHLTSNVRHSTFDFHRLTSDIRRSTFDASFLVSVG